jgi:hypothetical protein
MIFSVDQERWPTSHYPPYGTKHTRIQDATGKDLHHVLCCNTVTGHCIHAMSDQDKRYVIRDGKVMEYSMTHPAPLKVSRDDQRC